MDDGWIFLIFISLLLLCGFCKTIYCSSEFTIHPRINQYPQVECVPLHKSDTKEVVVESNPDEVVIETS